MIALNQKRKLTGKQNSVLNRASAMGAPYNRPIIPGSIHDGKRRDALTSAGQLGIMRRKLYVILLGDRQLNAL